MPMSWIEYKKAYDIVPHAWIFKCLNMVGTARDIELIRNGMTSW